MEEEDFEWKPNRPNSTKCKPPKIDLKKKCCYSFCKHVFQRTGGVDFFNFPSDPKLRKIWIKIMKENDVNWKNDPNKAKICSYHFRNQDFFQSKSMIKAKKFSTRKLKQKAVPYFPKIILSSNESNSSFPINDHQNQNNLNINDFLKIEVQTNNDSIKVEELDHDQIKQEVEDEENNHLKQKVEDEENNQNTVFVLL